MAGYSCVESEFFYGSCVSFARDAAVTRVCVFLADRERVIPRQLRRGGRASSGAAVDRR